MSIGVIFSLGCSKGYNKSGERVLKVGTQTDLLAFDPLNINALGENEIIDLISDEFLKIKNQKLIKGGIVDSFKAEKRNIIFNVSKNTSEAYKNRANIISNSKLWRSTASQFLTIGTSLFFSSKVNFIPQILTYIPLLRLFNEKFGAYKITEHRKRHSLLLERNETWVLEKNRNFDKIFFKRVKSLRNGLNMLQSNEIDVFLPKSEISILKRNEYKDLDVKFYKNKIRRLSLYHKYKAKDPLSFIFCSSENEIKKTLGSHWMKTQGDCTNQIKSKVNKDFLVISNTKKVYNIFDILSVTFKKFTGRKIIYKYLSGSNLTSALQKGKFDYYLTEESTSLNYPTFYDGFHSKGVFNTLKIDHPLLDQLLEESSQTESFNIFYEKDKNIKKLIKKIEPLVFRFKTPLEKLVCKKSEGFCHKSSLKKLIFN